MLGLSLLLDGPAAVGDALTTMGPETWWGVAFTALVASLVGYSIWNTLLGKYPTAKVVPFTLLIPAIGMGSAALVLREYPNALEIAGAAVLVLGVAVGTLRFKPRAKAPAGPKAERKATEGHGSPEACSGGTTGQAAGQAAGEPGEAKPSAVAP